MTSATAEEPTHIPRAPGHVLWIDEHGWESGSELQGVHAPIPVEEWIAASQANGYTVAWTPDGAIPEGPYRGGAVVEVDSAVPGDAGRAYFAVPPEALDHLRTIMAERDFQMVREDIDNIDNPEARGYTVTHLDPDAWEQRHAVVPDAEPLPTETWARVIREHHLQVLPPVGHSLPLDGLYPAGQVVSVDDATGRSYFAVPRAALGLAEDLAYEGADAATEGEAAPPDGGADENDDAPAPEGADVFRPVQVQWLDAAAWDEHGAIVPQYEPIPTALWAATIRTEGMRVTILPEDAAVLPEDSPYAGGRVVAVDDSGGRRYFAVPRAALDLARDLSAQNSPDPADTSGASPAAGRG